jgi:hypothetical protein
LFSLLIDYFEQKWYYSNEPQADGFSRTPGYFIATWQSDECCEMEAIEMKRKRKTNKSTLTIVFIQHLCLLITLIIIVLSIMKF